MNCIHVNITLKIFAYEVEMGDYFAGGPYLFVHLSGNDTSISAVLYHTCL